MKIDTSVIVFLVAIAGSPAFGQGKGGGNAGGGNPGAGKGGGSDRPSMSSPTASRPDAPDSTPNRRADRPRVDDAASVPGEPAQSAGKGRSASTAAHGLAASMHDINQTSFAQRRELHETLDMRLKSSRDALKKIQSDAKDLRADARADFKAALAEVKQRETDLTDAMKA
jgi:hypothetical protein